MTTEQMYSFNIDNEDTETVKDFVYLGSVNNSNVDHSQQIKKRLRVERAEREELGKITKSEDLSLKTKTEIIHALMLR